MTITDIGKGTIRTTTTDADGNYVFLNLLPSSYDLKIEAASGGFAPGAQRVELTVGQQANIPVQLGVAGITEKVDIVAGMEVVETDRTQQSSVVDVREQRRILTTTRAHGNRAAAPTEPLGFTSAANPRQLQFGVRFNF